VSSILDPQRRIALLEASLRALVRAHWGEEVAERVTAHRLPSAAILTGHDGEGTECAWGRGDGSAALGLLFSWSHRQGVDHLHVCTEATADTSAHARRATAFELPATVWGIEGNQLHEVAPVSIGPPDPPAPAALALRPQLEAAGVEVVVEEGLLRGEVLGLEVARVTVDEAGQARLEVGVGRHDREAHAELGADPRATLPDVVARVRELRRADAPVHPANQLASERWLRAVLVADPARVGLRGLVSRPSPVPRPDLGRRAPAPALGTDTDGRPVVVVCSVGVDPDLVPAAADARLSVVAEAPSGEPVPDLVLVVPAGDDHPLTRGLAGLLRHPAEVRTVDADWRRWTPR
jgi:hypothetical protein